MVGSITPYGSQDVDTGKPGIWDYEESRATRWNSPDSGEDFGIQPKFHTKRDEGESSNTTQRQAFTSSKTASKSFQYLTQPAPEGAASPRPPGSPLGLSEGYPQGTSITKILAQRRASAPSVSIAQQQQQLHAQQQIIVQYNAQHRRPGLPQATIARSKGASKEVYGFVCWITTFVAYGFYLLWGFLPENFLRILGVYYFPNKYWVVAGPTYLMVAILFGILLYICVNLINTDSLDSYHSFSNNPVSDHDHGHQENSIPAAVDLPLTLVNELLYQSKKPISNLSPTFSKFGLPISQPQRHVG